MKCNWMVIEASVLLNICFELERYILLFMVATITLLGLYLKMKNNLKQNECLHWNILSEWGINFKMHRHICCRQRTLLTKTAPPQMLYLFWAHAQHHHSFRAKHSRGPGESSFCGFDWTPQPWKQNMLMSHRCVVQSALGFHSERSLVARKDTQQCRVRHEVFCTDRFSTRLKAIQLK